MTSRIASWQFSPAAFAAELGRDLKQWMAERGLWWATSVVVHALMLSAALLVLGTVASAPAARTDLVTLTAEPIETREEEPIVSIQAIPLDAPPADSQPDLTNTLLPPGTTLDESQTAATGPGEGGPDTGWTDGDESFSLIAEIPRDRSGTEVLGKGPGPARDGVPGIYDYRRRGPGGGRSPGITGATKTSDMAVARALRWIARHQNADGSWSLDAFALRCKSVACTGQGSIKADGAATALGMLPFLAAGQTHLKSIALDKKAADYRQNVHMATYWLLGHQKVDGDLSAGSDQVMYSHGLATIALAELYALTHDKQVGSGAQRAVDFIVQAQHPETGGWRYKPGERGDTSVAGWQIMALKSAQIAGLSVPSRTIELAHRWLKSTAQSQGGLFAYEPAGGATPTMTAVGLLATQYLGADRQAPAMQEGVRYLMGQMPTAEARNSYYWYYATQVMHNLPGSEWDEWNRRMRGILITSQLTTAGLCGEGSWDSAQPSKDAWGEQGGRLMVTCLNCLTLQVYYRYLPLYQLDRPGAAK